MLNLDTMNWTLAQADPAPRAPENDAVTTEPGAPAAEPNGAAEQPPEAANPFLMFLPLILLLVVFWILIALPQRRERKRKEQMISTMKKGDRVQTIGGVLGTVAEIRDDEVVVKVDESNNTRLHFAKQAVQAVLNKDNAKSGT